jgi:DNA repair protein RecN (Recombination protein N)
LRRVNSRDGRKTAWINDRRTSGEVLRALSDTLVELHGQQDDRGLLNPRGHRDLLDAFAAAGAALEHSRARVAGIAQGARAVDEETARLPAWKEKRISCATRSRSWTR